MPGVKRINAVNSHLKLNPKQDQIRIKTALRAAKARAREALEAALKQAITAVTESDARAWFKHCG